METALLAFIVQRTGLPPELVERAYRAYPSQWRKDMDDDWAEIKAEATYQGVSFSSLVFGSLAMAKADNKPMTVAPSDVVVMDAAAKEAGTTVQVMCAVSNAEFYYYLQRDSEACP